MGQAELQNLIPLGAVLHHSLSQPKALELGAGVRLRQGRLHEVSGASADMFAIQTAAAQDNPILWMGLHRDIVTLNPAGLQAYLKVEDLILVEAVSRGELLWAADQALRAAGGFLCHPRYAGHAVSEGESALAACRRAGRRDRASALARSSQYERGANALGVSAALRRAAELGLGLPERQEWRSWPLADDGAAA